MSSDFVVLLFGGKENEKFNRKRVSWLLFN